MWKCSRFKASEVLAFAANSEHRPPASGKSEEGSRNTLKQQFKGSHESCIPQSHLPPRARHPLPPPSHPAAMSLSCQRVLRRCATVQSPVRASLSSTQSKQFLSRRWQSTDAEAAAPTNPKIAAIVDQIGQLTLLETADLVSSLKVSETCAACCSSRTVY